MDDKIKIDLSVTDDTNENKKNSQARDWCFTINNPVQSEQEFLEYLNTVTDLRYAVFQRERAPETGTEHYQGYFEFTQPKWFTTINVPQHVIARKLFVTICTIFQLQFPFISRNFSWNSNIISKNFLESLDFL